ncbi:hypothetical protein [Lacticaseibacillus sharpeae]|nr:hypothetical protein [Lacticaseibacillus sharpeae]
MLYMINHRLSEMLSQRQAVSSWLAKTSADASINFTDLDELLMARKYATQKQLQLIDDLVVEKLRTNSSSRNARPGMHRGYASYMARVWIRELAECEELPAGIRAAATACLKD